MRDLIAAHMAHCKAAGLSTNTIQDRENLLRRMDRSLPMGLRQATVEELEDWLSGPDLPAQPGQDPWTNQTKATYYGHVVGFFTWATDPNRGPILDWNPAASLTRPKVPAGLPRPVTNAELQYALGHARDPWLLLVILAAYAGLRCCELATIDRTDINEERLIIVGKGGKTRVVPTHEPVWKAVWDLPPGPLARGRTAENIARTGNRYLHRLTPGVTWHRYRHWFGTWLLRPKELGGAGADLRTVQKLMGHSNPATTAIYTQVSDEQCQMAIAALPVLAPATIRSTSA